MQFFTKVLKGWAKPGLLVLGGKGMGQTVTRTIILAIALTNAVLSMTGHNIIDIDESYIDEAVSIILLVYASVRSWWKNNSFTRAASAADRYMADLKKGVK